MRRLGRGQKYHARPRHLYALLFEDGFAYIGQSVDLRQRESQHRRPAGGWCGKPFRCLPLAVIHGTEEQARHYEHAWRHAANKHGWAIYAKPPGIRVDHRRQMTWYRYCLAWTLRWPRTYIRNRTWQTVKRAILGVAALLVAIRLI